MLGLAVCESVYGLLERNGIPKGEICNRFDDTVTVLTRALGASSRVVFQRTVVEIFRQYSQRAEFSYDDSLRDRLIVLKEAVVANHLIPKSRHDVLTLTVLKGREFQAGEKLAIATVPRLDPDTGEKVSTHLEWSIMSCPSVR